MMDRTTRPLVIVAAFAGSLVLGLVLEGLAATWMRRIVSDVEAR